ncbi:MAG: ABC transporter permease [Nocardiopsaceae bacterium]|nr:ABC transporter permease [Nocardiopsaceae bacterium]
MTTQTAEASRPEVVRLGRMERARRADLDILAVFVVAQVGCVIAGLVAPGKFAYVTTGNFQVMLQAIPELGIVAIGVGLLMIAGEFDLSVGANYTFAAIVMANLVTGYGMSPWGAAAIALLVGLLIGLLNAAVTFWLRIPSFITTLGSGLFWEGFTLLYHGAGFVSFTPTGAFVTATSGSFGVLEVEFCWFIVLAVVCGLLLHRHRLGNWFYAAGGNATAARAVGVRTRRVKTIAFAIAGVTAALAGILATSRVQSIVPGQGTDLPLNAIAACVIGGVALMGGRGTMLGIVLGSALIYLIQDVLLLLRAPGFYLQLFVGLLIIAAAGLNQFARGRAARQGNG